MENGGKFDKIYLYISLLQATPKKELYFHLKIPKIAEFPFTVASPKFLNRDTYIGIENAPIKVFWTPQPIISQHAL